MILEFISNERYIKTLSVYFVHNISSKTRTSNLAEGSFTFVGIHFRAEIKGAHAQAESISFLFGVNVVAINNRVSYLMDLKNRNIFK